ncbi:WXG100 family type VII secretion target [Goodfellowiella coeruleoviolacea]|uniref:WXG100 family type VII secretion target n=1 Tax=Goodfellowiella coeruleoviolacea TaxID=334858 RepID=A0AAE3GJR5_9PSEU|nr:WXG100 family type VII secretion target [Goodfellowiella coeruleoviolacea]MCP2168720.1 hypothetical protein [Goodfellowiella coeruleoviolacea]
MSLDITEENKFRGSGIVEAFTGLNQAISQDTESETEQVLNITFASIGAAGMTVAFAVDPFGTLLAAGIGWLIEHVSILREPLDQLMGDPDEIQAHTDGLKEYAAQIRAIADEHRAAVDEFQGWSGQAADAYRESMRQFADEVGQLADTTDTTAKIAAVNGVLVTTLRDIVRDMIAMLFAELIKGALVAAAAAVVTLGASIAGFIGYTVGRVAALGAQIGSRIAALLAAFGRQSGRLAQLSGEMGKLAKNFGRFATAGDVGGVGHEMAKAADAYK